MGFIEFRINEKLLRNIYAKWNYVKNPAKRAKEHAMCVTRKIGNVA